MLRQVRLQSHRQRQRSMPGVRHANYIQDVILKLGHNQKFQLQRQRRISLKN